MLKTRNTNLILTGCNSKSIEFSAFCYMTLYSDQYREAKLKQPRCHATLLRLAKTILPLRFGQSEAECMTIMLFTFGRLVLGLLYHYFNL